MNLRRPAHARSAATGQPTRRRLCGALALCAPAAWLSACASPPARGAAVPYRLVDRISWGANDSEIERAQRLGLRAYLQSQWLPASADTLPAAARGQLDGLTSLQRPLVDTLLDLEALRKGADATTGEDARKGAQQAYQQALNRHAREAGTRHLLRALYARSQLREQMTWFWLNHFNVHQYKANLRAMVGDYEETALRPHALSDFRAMLGAATRHPAMLRYLDNEHNAAGHGNENHARELMELHTLGVDGGYTQGDVQALARVLTGHGLRLAAPTDERPRLKREHEGLYVRRGAYEFNPARHDFGDKQLLGHTIRGRGADELDEALDLLVGHPSTARFVCRRIATYLVSDAPPEALVARMARAFGAGHLEAALQVLVASPEFIDGDAKFKDPMHYVVSALRAAYDDRVVLNTGPVLGWLNRLGEGLYNRATPDGYPLTAEGWNGSGQLAARFEVARAMGGGSSGLFKPDDPAAGAEQPAFPQLARAAYYAQYPHLREDTRQALARAASPQEWNALFLASPDFMVR